MELATDDHGGEHGCNSRGLDGMLLLRNMENDEGNCNSGSKEMGCWKVVGKEEAMIEIVK